MTATRKSNKRPGSVVRRKDREGYEARVTLPDGRRPSAYFPTSREGWEWVTRTLSDAQRGVLVVDGNRRMKDLCRDWMDNVATRNLRESSRYNYRLCIGYVTPHIGHHKVRDIQRPHIERMFRLFDEGDEHHGPLSRATQGLVHRILKQIFEYALDADMIARNPMRRMHAPRNTTRHDRVLSVEDCKRILGEALNTRWYPCFWLLTTTGMRISECLGLEWRNVDWRNSTITVERQTHRDIGKPGVRLEVLKTEASRRTIPVPRETMDVLTHHRDVQRLEQRKAEQAGNWHGVGTVFCTQTGTLYYRSQPTEALQRFTKVLGIQGVTLHTFRRSISTHIQAEGAPLRGAQMLLGHASDRTTYASYSLPSSDTQERVADLIGNLFGTANGDPIIPLTVAEGG